MTPFARCAAALAVLLAHGNAAVAAGSADPSLADDIASIKQHVQNIDDREVADHETDSAALADLKAHVDADETDASDFADKLEEMASADAEAGKLEPELVSGPTGGEVDASDHDDSGDADHEGDATGDDPAPDAPDASGDAAKSE